MGAVQSTRNAVIKHVNTAVVNTNNLPKDTVGVSATLSQNLKKIGQVQSPTSIQIQRSLEMTHVLRTRALSEDIQPNNTLGRTIDSFALSQLLDARKDADADADLSTPAKSQQLAERYRLDERMVQRLAKRYNTPSIGRENTIGLPDGDRRLYREAIWVDAGGSKEG